MQTCEVTAEMRGVLQDRTLRLNSLYQVRDAATGLWAPYRMNCVQERLWRQMWYWNVILKSRQHGITTAIAILGLDTAIFYPGQNIGFIGLDRPMAEKTMREKIREPWDRLPAEIRDMNPIVIHNTREIVWANGSGIFTGMTLRGGTYQFVHVSELGPLHRKFPERAKEVMEGLVPACPEGSAVFIESTSEGPAGPFHDIASLAQARTQSGRRLDKREFKFHFFPWWEKTLNRTRAGEIPVSDRHAAYFDRLEADCGVSLTPEQRAWYVVEEENLRRSGKDRDTMRRQHPSTPHEAWHVAAEGAIYGEEMGRARDGGRIGKVPLDPHRPVFVAFDIGYGDAMALWFFQVGHDEIRLIHYYEDTLKAMPHYLAYMQKRGYVYGAKPIFLPHDGASRNAATGLSPRDVAQRLGFECTVIEATADRDEIECVKSVLDLCWFDEAECQRGITCMRQWSRDYNEKMQRWEETPRHDDYSHACKSFGVLAKAYRWKKIGGEFRSPESRRLYDGEGRDYDPLREGIRL